MTRTMTRTIRTLFLAASLASPALAFAGPPDGARGEERQRRFEEHFAKRAEEAKIPAPTVAAIRAAMERARPEMEGLKAKLREARQSGTPAQADAAFQALHARKESLRKEIDGLLTPEQREALRKAGPHGRGRGHHGRGPWGPEGAGAGAAAQGQAKPQPQR